LKKPRKPYDHLPMALARTEIEVCTKNSPNQFHSRYNPELEAERFLHSVLGGRHPSIFLIVGGGMNYLGHLVSRLFPGSIHVSLQPCDFFNGHEIVRSDFNWFPSCGKSLQSVLSEALAEGHGAGGVAVIEWPAVVSRFPLETGMIRKAIRDVLESTSTSLATNAYWARRWLRNSIRFMAFASRFANISTGTCPIVIACPGPSLPDELDAIQKSGSNLALWALASAVPALRARRMEPELVISTDPGFWNGEHVRAMLASDTPLAMPPSSYAQDAILRKTPIVPLDTDLLFEADAIKATGHPGKKASAAGSALGTALSLALTSTTGSVAVAGYDLAAKGIDDHVRPYPFDILEETKSLRFRPGLSIRSERVYENFKVHSGGWRHSRTFSAYASSIRADQADSARVIRLGDSPVESGLPHGSLASLASQHGSHPRIDVQARPMNQDHGNRHKAIEILLEVLIHNSLTDAASAIMAGNPLKKDSILVFKALAPGESATMLAEAARGRANLESLKAIESSARHCALELLRIQ